MMTLPELLSTEFQITDGDLDKSLKYQAKYGGHLEQILVNLGSLPEDSLPEVYSRYFQLPELDITEWLEAEVPDIEPETFSLLEAACWSLLAVEGERWTFAAKYPLDLSVNEFIRRFNIEANIIIGTEADIQTLNRKFNLNATADNDDAIIGDEEERLRELASEAPTVNLLNSLISRG